VGLAVATSAWLLHHDLLHHGALRTTVQGVSASRAPVNGRLEQAPFESSAAGWDRRAAQRRDLEAYAWVDRKNGIVHVPIERAMELLAERGTLR
jgi:hypothetical protein